jgi:hypothetical protein
MAKTIKGMTLSQAIYTMQIQMASNKFTNMSLKCTLNNGKTAFMTVLKDQLEMVQLYGIEMSDVPAGLELTTRDALWPYFTAPVEKVLKAYHPIVSDVMLDYNTI